ncbi:hypothetical protein CMV_013782 [Castanea mollissima]|uniref:Uncharacterized protein n=1 Tax=Castanea mollissima TaxID=60419 RepID=A0A8J4RD71_9ROSI|nr:hypothetical protein CMV_013782 [Castanea mollissima]
MSLSPIHLLHLSLTHHSTQIAASLLSLSEGPCILLAAFNLQSLLLLTSAPPPPPPPQVDTSLLNVAEAFSEDQLWAASCLRVRSFYNFTPTAYAIHFY